MEWQEWRRRERERSLLVKRTQWTITFFSSSSFNYSLKKNKTSKSWITNLSLWQRNTVQKWHDYTPIKIGSFQVTQSCKNNFEDKKRNFLTKIYYYHWSAGVMKPVLYQSYFVWNFEFCTRERRVWIVAIKV